MTHPPHPEHPTTPSRTPAKPPTTRTLTALIAGHVLVSLSTVMLTGLLILDGLTDSTDDLLPDGSSIAIVAVGMLAASLGALALGQILSIRRLTTHSRATATGRLDEPALAAGVQRIGWPVVLAFYPLILGLLHLGLNPPPPALLAALVAVIATAMLLDLGHAAWAYRRLVHTTGTRPLPPGSRSRIHAGQRVTAVLYIGAALAGALLLVATVLTEIARPDPSPPATVVQLAAAAAAMLVPLLLVRPVLRVSAAITTTPHFPDLADLAALDRAAQPFIKLTSLSTLAAVLTAAALATAPADPAVAVGRALPLLLVLGSATLQLGSLTSINLADTAQPAPGRRR